MRSVQTQNCYDVIVFVDTYGKYTNTKLLVMCRVSLLIITDDTQFVHYITDSASQSN